MATEEKVMVEEEKKPIPAKKVNVSAFKARKLKDINNMQDKAKAKKAAEKILRIKEV